MNHLLVSLAFSMIVLATAHAAPLQRDVRTAQIPLNALFSDNTLRFVTITEDGDVHAKGDAGSAESQFYITYLEGDQVKFKSAKVETCSLLFNNTQFMGGLPTENNDLFEIVNLEFSMIALRVFNPMHTQQGGLGASGTSEIPEVNTEEVQTEDIQSPVSECYLGFDIFGNPECYDSTDNQAAKFLLIPLS